MTAPLVVVYDRGAASASEIVVGLAELGPVVFLVGDSAHTRQVGQVLRGLAPAVPLADDPEANLPLVRRLRPAAILTFSEPMLPVTAYLANRLGLPFHSVDGVRLLTDKRLQRERLRQRGVDEVRSRAVSRVEEWPGVRRFVGLPAVIKPVYGQGSHDTHLVADDTTASRLLAELLSRPGAGAVVVEELLVGRPSGPYGDYVSVESFRTADRVGHIAVTGKLPLAPPFRETGRFWPAALTPRERQAVTDLVTKALVALEVGPGLTHSEIKLTPDGPRVIEVNGRLGGHVNGLARQVAGLDMVRLAGLLALGREMAPPDRVDLPGRVHFQHNTLAPVDPCELVSMRGEQEVRRSAGIRGFRAYARPGQVFDSDVMTRHLDLLWGDCPRHTDMVQIINEVRHHLVYEFRFPDGLRQLTATDLQKRVPA